MHLNALDYGTVPDWFSGLGATLALLFAFFAVRAAQRTNQQQTIQLARLEDDQRRRDETERARQAVQVASWITEDANRKWQYILNNVSGLPIHNVIVYAEGVLATNHGEARPSGEIINVQRVLMVPPCSADSPVYMDIHWVATINRNHLPLVGILFRDCAGAHWERRPTGEFTFLDDAQADCRRKELDHERVEALQRSAKLS